MLNYGNLSQSNQTQRKNFVVANVVNIDEVITSPFNRSINQPIKKFSIKPKWGDNQLNSQDKYHNRHSQSSYSIGDEDNSISSCTTGYSNSFSQQSYSQLDSLSFSQTEQSSLNKFNNYSGLKTDSLFRRQNKSYTLPYASSKGTSINWNQDSKEVKELSQTMSIQNSLQEQKKLLQDIANRTRESVSELKGVSTLMSSLDSGKLSSKESYSLLTEEIKQMRESMLNRDTNIEKLLRQSLEQKMNIDIKDKDLNSIENIFSKHIEQWVTKLQQHIDGKFESVLKSISSIQHDPFDPIPFDNVSNISYQSTHCGDLDIFENIESQPTFKPKDMDNLDDIFMSDFENHSYKEEKNEDSEESKIFETNENTASASISKTKRKRKKKKSHIQKICYPLEWADDPSNAFMNAGIITRAKRVKYGIDIPQPPDGFEVH